MRNFTKFMKLRYKILKPLKIILRSENAEKPRIKKIELNQVISLRHLSTDSNPFQMGKNIISHIVSLIRVRGWTRPLLSFGQVTTTKSTVTSEWRAKSPSAKPYFIIPFPGKCVNMSLIFSSVDTIAA